MASIVERISGSFQVKLRRRGLRALSKTFPSRPEAEAWAAEQEGRLTSGVPDNAHLSRTETLHAALEWYRDNVTTKKRNTRSEESRIRSLLAHQLAQRPLDTVKPEDLEDLISELLGRGLSTATARHYVALISHVFNTAVKLRRMRGLQNPASMIQWPVPAGPRRRRFASKREEKKLYAALEAQGNVWARPLAEFLAESAMRVRSEALALTWPEVNLRTRVAMLYDTKNGEDRPVALTPKAVAILKALPRVKGDARVFPVNYDTYVGIWKRACDKAGIQDLNRHDMRREATSRLFEIHGLEQIEAAAITGHKTLSLLNDYARLKATRLAQRLKKA